MQYKKYIIENVLVILIGLGLYYMDYLEFNDAYIKVLIIFFALIKSTYFVFKCFKGIVESSNLNIYYHQYLSFLALNFSIIVISFSVDYICLFYVDGNSFSELPPNLPLYDVAFKLTHFSVLIFSNIGIVKIVPESNTANALMMFEAILSFATILFFLSDFISLKESLQKQKNDRYNK